MVVDDDGDDDDDDNKIMMVMSTSNVTIEYDAFMDIPVTVIRNVANRVVLP